MNGVEDGLAVVDQNRGIVHINAIARRLLGLSGGMTFDGLESTFQLFDEEGVLVPSQRWPVAQAFQGEFLSRREFRIRRKDTGVEVFTEISTSPIPDSKGRVHQVMVTYRDVTRPKESDALSRRLAAIVESSQDAIIGKDTDGIVTTWNAGATNIFGYPAAEMIGQSIKRLMPPDHEEEEDQILKRIRNGETVDHIETVRRKKNGKFIHVSLTISPIRDSAGKIIGASKIARNITDRKQLEVQLYQAQKMDAIGQLTGGIAHDFNNLLGVIIGNLDLLARLVNGNEAAESRVRTATKAASRGADLTRRLLAFSSAGELRPTRLRLEDPIANTIELAARALGPEIVIHKHLDGRVPPIFVDAAGLESALLNIIVNARDAMPRGGTITITTQLATVVQRDEPAYGGELKQGSYAYLSISDTGGGMPRDVLDRAFEPFFTTKDRGKGTGLGLAMVYGFAKQSHGMVRLYSEAGYGTTVSMYLPLAEQHDLPQPPIPQMPDTEESGATVLLVDDEPELLEIAHVYLREAGYTVLEARDAPSATEVLREHPEVKLMVTDIVMPGGSNGVELGQAIREAYPKMKVVYCSGFPADALAVRNKPLDGPFLRKPYDRYEFISVIRRTLDTQVG